MNRTKLKKILKLLKHQQRLISLVELIQIIKKMRLRRWWVKPHLHHNVRIEMGACSLFSYFNVQDQEEFLSFFRMTPDEFNRLHELVRHLLQKNVTSLRKPIKTEIRLAVTLHYLAYGGSIKTHSWFFRIGVSTTYKIISETCQIIKDVLIPQYVPLPNEAKWRQIEKDFNEKWNFPNCIGAIDGKHIQIQRPMHGGSLFINYMKYHSVVLMACSDAHSRFTWFSVGDFGSYSDSSIFGNTDFAAKIENNELHIPPPQNLPNTEMTMPFVFVGDEIFALKENFMKPYSRRQIDITNKIFNYRLSRARWTIESAFGILTARWKILRNALTFNLQTIDNIVASCVSLHNYLLSIRNPDWDVVQINNEEVPEVYERILPALVRNKFAQYFVSPEGAVPWQDNYI